MLGFRARGEIDRERRNGERGNGIEGREEQRGVLLIPARPRQSERVDAREGEATRAVATER